jgi:hypothetical protein
MKDQLSYLLEKEWIRPSHSPYGSPVLFAPKPGGKLRMCIDYRSVNKGTVKSSYPLPRVEEMFDQVVGSHHFSKIDLRSGYWQIRMEESSIPPTTFKTRYGSFEWLVMPFGLSTAPSCFQHLVNSILGDVLDKHALVFIDDILIYSKDIASHASHIELVLQRLREHSLFAKFSKCEWVKAQISFLGHVVNSKGVKPQREKTAVIAAWPAPKNVHEVRSFLGLTGYYRKFVHSYAQICSPLTDLTKTGVRFVWTDDCQRSFEKLKSCLITEPLLRHPDPSRVYHVYTDSSMRAVGGVAAQMYEDGEHPVQFESRLMTGAELNYQVHEQELLALVYILGKFRHLLEGVKFKVFTDNRSLVFLTTQKDLSRRQARWQELLSRYDFELKHIAGVKNVIADALSRMPTRGFDSLPAIEEPQPSKPRDCKGLGDWNLDIDSHGRIVEDTPAALGKHASGSTHTGELGEEALITKEVNTLARESFSFESDFLQLVAESQQSDAKCMEVRKAIGADSEGHHRGFTVKNGIVYKGREPDLQLVIPTKELQEKVISMCHDCPVSGHLGSRKTIDLVARHCWFKQLKDVVARYVQSCPICQASKPGGAGPGPLMPLPVPKGRWTSVSTDMMTSLPPTENGLDSIIIFVDRFSKFVYIYPCSERTGSEGYAFAFLNTVFKNHGVPEEIVSDRDGRFIAHWWTSFTQLLGIDLKMTSGHRPQADGLSERYNRSIQQVLRCFCSRRQSTWHKYIPLVQFALNNSIAASTGKTPFFVNYGEHPSHPVGLLTGTIKHRVRNACANEFVEAMQRTLRETREQLARSRQIMKAQADKNRKPRTLDKGDLVLLSTQDLAYAFLGPSKKLKPRWTGPFKILEKLSELVFRVDLPEGWRIHPVFNIDRLKLFRTSSGEFADRSLVPLLPHEIDSEFEYEVEDIIGHQWVGREPNRRIEYLVLWAGYPLSDASYQTEGDLKNATEIVREYRRRKHLD